MLACGTATFHSKIPPLIEGCHMQGLHHKLLRFNLQVFDGQEPAEPPDVSYSLPFELSFGQYRVSLTVLSNAHLRV